MKITITQKHIKQGSPNNGVLCPIALALLEQTGEQWNVTIGTTGAIAHSCNELTETYLPLPKTAHKFAINFDAGKPVNPFSFIFKRS